MVKIKDGQDTKIDYLTEFSWLEYNTMSPQPEQGS